MTQFHQLQNSLDSWSSEFLDLDSKIKKKQYTFFLKLTRELKLLGSLCKYFRVLMELHKCSSSGWLIVLRLSVLPYPLLGMLILRSLLNWEAVALPLLLAGASTITTLVFISFMLFSRSEFWCEAYLFLWLLWFCRNCEQNRIMKIWEVTWRLPWWTSFVEGWPGASWVSFLPSSTSCSWSWSEVYRL